MKPEFITFTGADDFTSIDDMILLSSQYPWRIEWGILLSEKRMGERRYPSVEFMRNFRNIGDHISISLHVCGRLARALVEGEYEQIRRIVGYCNPKRIQINIQSVPDMGFIHKMADKGHRDIILQCRGYGFPEDDAVSWLFDKSGGTGEKPISWPIHPGNNRLVGYAGGIDPDNVLDVVGRVGGVGPYWLDMESGVRTDNIFDIAKCMDVCRQVYGQ